MDEDVEEAPRTDAEAAGGSAEVDEEVVEDAGGPWDSRDAAADDEDGDASTLSTEGSGCSEAVDEAIEGWRVGAASSCDGRSTGDVGRRAVAASASEWGLEEREERLESPFNPGGRWEAPETTEAYVLEGTEEPDEVLELEIALTSGTDVGGLDKASATTLALPSMYRISVVNSDTTDN